jgi:hypothetical protein
MANGQMGAVGDVNPCLLARKMMQEQAKWHEQARLERHETAIAGQVAEQKTIMLRHTIKIKQLEIAKATDMEKHHDEEHL